MVMVMVMVMPVLLMPVLLMTMAVLCFYSPSLARVSM